MCEQITIEYQYQCTHGQDKGFLLAVRKVSGEQTPEFAEYHRRIDVCSVQQLPPDVYIQLTFYGNKLMPFSILVPYSEEAYAHYNENKHKVFDIVVGDNTNTKDEKK